MSNCFEFRCPKCGGEDEIDIGAKVWIRVTEEGTDPDQAHHGGHEYTPDSNAKCFGCRYLGLLSEFTRDEVQP